MFPNQFLRTFWQLELQPQIFVAMSFAPEYEGRFKEVIEPAITGIRVNGVQLRACRVDLSRSGDSILTDIMDGIAHSQMVLADVSVIGHDSKSGKAYRNGNVMYEVGVALACRQSSEILLIRDSDDRTHFLFDVSTIPHQRLDFANTASAKKELQDALMGRMRERMLTQDARVRRAIASLTSEEIEVIKRFADNSPPTAWGFPGTGSVNFLAAVAIPRMCDSHLIRTVGTWPTGGGAYQWTQLGSVVAQLVKKGLPTLMPAGEASAPVQNPATVEQPPKTKQNDETPSQSPE